MPLPGLTLPFSFPPFVSTEHGAQHDDQYAVVNMRTGHSRKRRAYLFSPVTFNVALDLSQEQAQEFHNWYEGPLKAAGELFSAQVQAFGPGLLWYAVSFVEPYTITPSITGRWRVTAKLLSYTVGTADGPDFAALEAAFDLPLNGSAALTVVPQLAVEYGLAIEGISTLDAIDFSLAFEEGGIVYMLIESGDFLLTEDGNKIVLGYGTI